MIIIKSVSPDDPFHFTIMLPNNRQIQGRSNSFLLFKLTGFVIVEVNEMDKFKNFKFWI